MIILDSFSEISTPCTIINYEILGPSRGWAICHHFFWVHIYYFNDKVVGVRPFSKIVIFLFIRRSGMFGVVGMVTWQARSGLLGCFNVLRFDNLSIKMDLI